MDSSDPSALSCISAVKNRKRKATDRNVYISMRIPPKRLYFTPPSRRQRWSFPESIIYYMAKNPKSPKVYRNLIKSSRYFLAVNPIIVCSELSFDSCKSYDTNPNINDDEFKPNECKVEIEDNGKEMILDLKSYKFWIIDAIYIKAFDLSAAGVPSVINRIYQCDAKNVNLGDITISFNAFTFLAKNAEEICLYDVDVKDDVGTVVALKKLFEVEVMVNLKTIEIDTHYIDMNISSEIVKNLLKIPHFLTLKVFCAIFIPDTFDIETFYTHMKKNKATTFILHFFPISDAFKVKIEAINNEIMATEILDFKVPFIMIDEQDKETRDKLTEIFALSARTTF